MKLEEYAAQHPQTEPIREQQGAYNYHERMQDLEEADKLRADILEQLKRGAAPETILYMALKTIGLLSQDKEWTEAGKKILDKTYSDIAQESLLTDTDETAAQRLEQMRTEYNDKLKRQITSNINSCRRLEKALQEVLNTMTPDE